MVTVDSNASSLTVDCRGMQCPAPILRLAETARKFKYNPTSLTVLATDEDFPMDLEAWCRSAKASITSISRDGGEIHAVVALAGALSEMARLGGGTVESYPEAVAARTVSGSFLYNSTLALFEGQGFQRVRRLGKNHWVVTRVVEAQ